MLHVRLIGGAMERPNYGYLVEAVGTGLFYCFDQKKFTDDLRQPVRDLPRIAEHKLQEVPLLAGLFADNLDTTGWPDGDYHVYYTNWDRTWLMTFAPAVIVAGDDQSVLGRVRQNPALLAFNGSVKGLPGAPPVGVQVSGRANLTVAAPRP